MATPGGLVDKQELIDAQLDTAHLGRVVNSKDASGAPISESTNRTGGVNKTLDALEAEYQGDIDNFVQVSDQLITDKTVEFDQTITDANVAFDDQRDQFETTFNAQFTYKRIGNISDYAGQSLPEADKLNSYQYPDDSGAWYAPVQGQSFPITIPADPTVSGSEWVLIASPNIYRGLWPDNGGSANKGETWQTQTGGAPTGQYFTALQNTTVDPVGDNTNWHEVVSVASLGGQTNYQTASVQNMKEGKTLKGQQTITAQMIDSDDISISTQGYYGGWAGMTEPVGSSNYLLTTLQRVRDGKGDQSWVPDEFGDHYLFNGTAYVAVKNANKIESVDSYGAKPFDVTFDSHEAIQACANANAAFEFNSAGNYLMGATLLFRSGCNINLNTCEIKGDKSVPMFESAYWNAGTLETTYGLPLGNFASRHFGSKIYNGSAFNTLTVFKLQQVLIDCNFYDVISYDADQMLDLVEGYYSDYSRLTMLLRNETPDYVSRTITTTSGSNIVTVNDPTDIIIGSYVLSHSLPKGYSIVTAIAGSDITLNNNATKTVVQGGLFSGAVFSKEAVKPKPGFSISTACSQLNISSCSSSSRMSGFFLEGVTSTHFDVVDSEGVGIAFEIGDFVQAKFTSPYLEGVRYAAFAGLDNDTNSDLIIEGLHSGTGAGIAAMVLDTDNGAVNARMKLNYGNIGGYTPYGFDRGNAKPFFDVTNVSSNVDVEITSKLGDSPFFDSLEGNEFNRLSITEIKGGSRLTNARANPTSPTKTIEGYTNDGTIQSGINYFNSDDRKMSDQVAGGISCAHKEFFDHIPGKSGYVNLVKKFTNASVSKTEIHFGLSEANTTSTEAITRWFLQTDGFKPFSDNAYTIGDATHRPTEIFAVNGTINTSDERLKTPIEDITEAERKAALEIKSNIGKYKFLDAIESKGDDARIHWGVGAQTVKSIMEKHGLDAFKYSLLCLDEWYEIDGVIVEPDIDGTYQDDAVRMDRYGVRYSELMCFIISAL